MKKLLKVKPMFNRIITTMDVYEKDQYNGNIIDTTKQKGSLKEYQTVLSVGTTVRDIKEGDLVCINPTRFAVRKHKDGSLKDGVISDNPVVDYKFDIVEMNNTPYLLLQDRDINFIVEDYEEDEEEKSPIINTDKTLIL